MDSGQGPRRRVAQVEGRKRFTYTPASSINDPVEISRPSEENILISQEPEI